MRAFILMRPNSLGRRIIEMYDYILNELPSLIEENFPTNGKRSIMGHSMGGHGALVLALRNRERYQSVSAFSPILSPSLVPWGEKAFSAYLGKIVKNGNNMMPARSFNKAIKCKVCALIKAWKMSFYQHNCVPKILSKPVVRQISRSTCASIKAMIIAITSSPVLLVSILHIMSAFLK